MSRKLNLPPNKGKWPLRHGIKDDPCDPYRQAVIWSRMKNMFEREEPPEYYQRYYQRLEKP